MSVPHRLRQQGRGAQASDVGRQQHRLYAVPDGSECLMPPDDDKASTSRPENVLAVSPWQFRQYAANCKASAAAAATDGERQIYLKMASVWLHAAVEFESGTSTEDKIREGHRRRVLGE
jgi:hypothetical protein